MPEEKSREQKIKEIRKLYKQNLGRKKGVILSHGLDYELEVEALKYQVLTRDGMYCGYYLEPYPSYADRTIVSQIVASQECHKWEGLEDDELDGWLNFLRDYQKGSNNQ